MNLNIGSKDSCFCSGLGGEGEGEEGGERGDRGRRDEADIAQAAAEKLIGLTRLHLHKERVRARGPGGKGRECEMRGREGIGNKDYGNGGIGDCSLRSREIGMKGG